MGEIMAKFDLGQVHLLPDAQRRTGMGVREFLRRLLSGPKGEYHLIRAMKYSKGIALFVTDPDTGGKFSLYAFSVGGRLLIGTRADFDLRDMGDRCGEIDRGLMDAAMKDLEKLPEQGEATDG